MALNSSKSCDYSSVFNMWSDNDVIFFTACDDFGEFSKCYDLWYDQVGKLEMPPKKKTNETKAAAEKADGKSSHELRKQSKGKASTVEVEEDETDRPRRKSNPKSNGRQSDAGVSKSTKTEVPLRSRSKKQPKTEQRSREVAQPAANNRRSKRLTPTKEPKIPAKRQKKVIPIIETSNSSSSSESEWEEVAEHNVPEPEEAAGSSSGLQITVNAPKTKKQLDAETMIKREINKFRKEFQEDWHKAHLLVYIAHGRQLSYFCNDPMNRALALSNVPVGYCDLISDPEFGKAKLQRFVKWFRSSFSVDKTNLTSSNRFDGVTIQIRNSLESRIATGYKNLTLCFVTTMRAVGFDVRIVFNAHPVSRVPAGEVDVTLKSDDHSGSKTKKLKQDKESTGKTEKQTEQMPEPIRCDYWAEVYVENMERWIPIDCIQGTADDLHSLREHFTKPIIYCLAFDKDLAMKDVTVRYSDGFLSPQIRRQRVNIEWWEKTEKVFGSQKILRSRLEEMQLQALLAEQPLPSKIAEYKNHPLYVLKKDLKKFEAIFPADTKPVGYLKNEPVYPRNAVHTLHSEDTWKKEARVVKKDEKPFKTVKGRPKVGVPKELQSDRQVEIFGLWQTEPYVPQPAVNGIIPRNQYGNVELFQKSMLPPGTVHLPIAGLLHVARKLNIDCAPAMVGWDFHGRGSHPLLDGFVVCEEHKDALLAAYDEDQALAEEREKERRTKRSLKNWRRLTRALLIRESLKVKFLRKESDQLTKIKSPDRVEKPKKTKVAETGETSNETASETAAAWPQNKRQFTFESEVL